MTRSSDRLGKGLDSNCLGTALRYCIIKGTNWQWRWMSSVYLECRDDLTAKRALMHIGNKGRRLGF